MTLSLDALRKRIRGQGILKPIINHAFSGKVYLVGGAIRELILGRAPRDYDFALSSREDLPRFEKIFNAPSFLLGKKPIQTHRIVSEGVTLDITILEATIEEDLFRRDFTMNSMAYDVTGDEVIDTEQGMADIRRHLIRYPHKETVRADPLRMLKAVRHYATLKKFRLDNLLIGAITEMGDLIKMVAPERVKFEMDQIMASPGVYQALLMLEETGLLFRIFPELLPLKALDKEKGFLLETYGHMRDAFRYLPRYARSYRLDGKTLKEAGYALLFHDLGKASTYSYDEAKDAVHFFFHEKESKALATLIMERLRFSAHEMRAILALVEQHMRIFLITSGGSSEKAVRRLVYKMGDLVPPLVVLTLCDMYGSSRGEDNPSTRAVKKRCREILKVYEEWKKEPLPALINGRDLLAMGFSQGPKIGETLAMVREQQIAGELKNREDALFLASASLKKQQIAEEK